MGTEGSWQTGHEAAVVEFNTEDMFMSTPVSV